MKKLLYLPAVVEHLPTLTAQTFWVDPSNLVVPIL